MLALVSARDLLRLRVLPRQDAKRQQPTPDLVYENAHVPISVSLGDTLEKTPTHIGDRDPKSLVRQFMAELKRRSVNIQMRVMAEFVPEDLQMMQGRQAYGCELEKSWLPCEWFDSPEKLNYPGLPDYPAWYSRLKSGLVLKLSDWKACKRLFKVKGIQTFADWLCYYKNLDVAPGLEALQNMHAFCTEKGIDILKDAVRLPGVSMHYLLRGMIERGTELFSPC